MTRINAGIAPRLLSNAHLRAEHREIKRLPNHLAKHGLKSIEDAPREFVLGPGHVKFFLKHGRYTYRRYMEIYEECKRRGFNVTDYSTAWEIYTDPRFRPLYNNSAFKEHHVNQIKERLLESDPVFYGKYQWFPKLGIALSFDPKNHYGRAM